MVDNSKTLTDIKETFFNGDPDYFKAQIGNWISQFGMSTEDVRNLSVSALLLKLAQKAEGDAPALNAIKGLQGLAEKFGLSSQNADDIIDLK